MVAFFCESSFATEVFGLVLMLKSTAMFVATGGRSPRLDRAC